MISAAARRPHDLAARFGGEEFAVVLPHTPAHGAVFVAERIRDRVAAAAIPHRGSLVAGHVTVSIGIACGRPSTQPAGPDGDERGAGGECELVAAADRALYAAKRGGRDRIELVAADAASGATGAPTTALGRTT